jgi:hypothetical protein
MEKIEWRSSLGINPPPACLFKIERGRCHRVLAQRQAETAKSGKQRGDQKSEIGHWLTFQAASRFFFGDHPLKLG